MNVLLLWFVYACLLNATSNITYRAAAAGFVFCEGVDENRHYNDKNLAVKKKGMSSTATKESANYVWHNENIINDAVYKTTTSSSSTVPQESDHDEEEQVTKKEVHSNDFVTDNISICHDNAFDNYITQEREGDEQADAEDHLKKENGIIVLTQDNFNFALRNHGAILLILHAPWCSHSLHLVKKMEQTALLLRDWMEVNTNSSTQRLQDSQQEGYERFGGIDIFSILSETQSLRIEQDDDTTDTKENQQRRQGRKRSLLPTLAKLDVNTEADIADLFRVKGHPTLKLLLPVPSSLSRKDFECNAGSDDEMSTKHSCGSKSSSSSWKRKDDVAFDVIDYDGPFEKTSHDLLEYLIHYWTRNQRPAISTTTTSSSSPIFNLQGGEGALRFFVNWVQNGTMNPSMHNAFLEGTSVEGAGSVIFAQCRGMRLNVDSSLVNDFNCDRDGDGVPCQERRTRNSAQCISGIIPDGCCGAPCDSRDWRKEKIDALTNEFESIAKRLIEFRHVYFAHTSSEGCELLGMTLEGQVRSVVSPDPRLLLPHIDRKVDHVEYSIKGEIYDPLAADRNEPLDAFVWREWVPLVTWFNRENVPMAFGAGREVHVSLFIEEIVETSMQTQMALNALRIASYQHRHLGYVFMIIPDGEHRITNYFGIYAVPSVLITDVRGRMGMKKFFLPTDELTNKVSIADFVKKFNDNLLIPLLKSESLSNEDAIGHVKVVKGISFNAMVMESNRHSIVNFFAPYCAHSKRLGPQWSDLASRIDELDWNVDVMKMDATENEIDHPMVDILGFPSIYYFPLGNKTKPVFYNSERRSANDVLDWLLRNGLDPTSV